MYRKKFIDLYLDKNFDFNEAKSEVDFALETMFNYKYKDFLLGKLLEKWQIEKMNKAIEERVSTHKPLQQILGQAYFYGRKFFVNEFTLIPRPETELLVSKVLESITNQNEIKVLDIGSGTGCIPITLVLENANITADSVDISIDAINIARKNALLHNVYEKVNFFKSDLFKNIKSKYNIIVSNPPYIPIREKENLQTEVKDFEPDIALFTSDDKGLEYYNKIISQAGEFLLNDGLLFFEIGMNQSEEILNILKKNNFKNIYVYKDLNLADRVICAQK